VKDFISFLFFLQLVFPKIDRAREIGTDLCLDDDFGAFIFSAPNVFEIFEVEATAAAAVEGGGAIRNRVIFFRIKDIFLLLHIRTSSHSHFFKRSPFFIINNMYNSCSICSSPISSSNMVVKTMYIDISSRGLHYFRFCFL